MSDTQPPTSYLPLFAEKRCLVCGYWRGQHTVQGDARNDTGMLCPVDASWFQVTASFVPGSERGRDYNAARAVGVSEKEQEQ